MLMVVISNKTQTEYQPAKNASSLVLKNSYYSNTISQSPKSLYPPWKGCVGVHSLLVLAAKSDFEPSPYTLDSVSGLLLLRRGDSVRS